MVRKITLSVVCLLVLTTVALAAGPSSGRSRGARTTHRPSGKTFGRTTHRPQVKTAKGRASVRKGTSAKLKGSKGKVRRTPKTSPARKRPQKFSRVLIAKHNGAKKFVKNRVTDKGYARKFGKRFRFTVNGKTRWGWYYPGRHHRHWKFFSYNAFYRKWLFYDECTLTYYYFCNRCTCYRPIEYACQVCMDTPDDPEVNPCGCGESDNQGDESTGNEGKAEEDTESNCCGKDE
jgi:hypothetical protein